MYDVGVVRTKFARTNKTQRIQANHSNRKANCQIFLFIFLSKMDMQASKLQEIKFMCAKWRIQFVMVCVYAIIIIIDPKMAILRHKINLHLSFNHIPNRNMTKCWMESSLELSHRALTKMKYNKIIHSISFHSIQSLVRVIRLIVLFWWMIFFLPQKKLTEYKIFKWQTGNNFR